jgi:hypothetical protein
MQAAVKFGPARNALQAIEIQMCLLKTSGEAKKWERVSIRQ